MLISRTHILQKNLATKKEYTFFITNQWFRRDSDMHTYIGYFFLHLVIELKMEKDLFIALRLIYLDLVDQWC